MGCGASSESVKVSFFVLADSHIPQEVSHVVFVGLNQKSFWFFEPFLNLRLTVETKRISESARAFIVYDDICLHVDASILGAIEKVVDFRCYAPAFFLSSTAFHKERWVDGELQNIASSLYSATFQFISCPSLERNAAINRAQPTSLLLLSALKCQSSLCC